MLFQPLSGNSPSVGLLAVNWKKIDLSASLKPGKIMAGEFNTGVVEW